MKAALHAACARSFGAQYQQYLGSTVLTMLLAASLMTFSLKGQAAVADHIRGDAPSVYTVVEGDSLWSISGRFLTQPWLWPEIWEVNPQIENPHLIYPGDQIGLTLSLIHI